MDHISHSSICLYLNNPAAWYSKYVMGIRDQKTNPSALTGSAFHKYAESIHKGIDKNTAKEIAVQLLKSTQNVDFGKTGSIEKCSDDLDKLITWYSEQESELKIGKILGVEAGYTHKIPGIKYPLKGYIDLIHENNSGLVIIDWKTVSSYEESPTPSQILQGCIYYWLIKKAHRHAPTRFDIVQIKASKNSDGSPQMKTLSIVFKNHPEYLLAMKDLVRATVKEMDRKRKIVLFNPRDDYEGRAEFERFIKSYIREAVMA